MVASHQGTNGSSSKLVMFDLVLSGKASSRKDIINALSMRPNTVSEVVNQLVDMDLIWEQRSKSSGRGRPTVSLVANANRFVSILFQIVGQSVVVSLLNLAGQELWSSMLKLGEDADNDEILSVFSKLYLQARAAVPKTSDRAFLIFSLPGLLDQERCVWQFATRWPNMSNLALEQVVEAKDETIKLFRNLDLELAALTAQERAKPARALIVHWGQGIGSSFSSPREWNMNRGGQFGEVGHWVMARAGTDKCRCGGIGCLETVASLWALTPHLKKRWPELGDDEQAVASQLQTLDLLSVPEFMEAVKAISNTLTNLSRTFFPSKILVTGPFVENPYVWAELNRRYAMEGQLSTVETPPLINVSRSLELERKGALDAVMPEYLHSYMEETMSSGNENTD